MTEQLITNLTNLPNVKVIARTSVMQFKNSVKTIQQIAQELGVVHVLEGSVRKAGNKIRVTAQLIKADDGFHLWAKDYDRQLKDIFAVQDDVSNAIVEALKINFTGEQKALLTKRYTENIEAYDAFLKGKVHLEKGGPKNLQIALRYFELSVEKESRFALGYVEVAKTWSAMMGGGPSFSVSPSEGLPKMKEAAIKAVEIDGQLPEAHLALANVFRNEWDWSNASKEIQQALELGPNNPEVCAANLSFRLFTSRKAASMPELDRCLALDPLSLSQQTFRGSYLLNTGRTDEAIK
jgi:tetratricopeptide (TPR) repeat protein